MSIRYKFRSCVKFDTWEIENRGSVSVRELRERILGGKNPQRRQQGFDLVFYDEDTGLEYIGDDSQIPSGSSVIVKRVPGGTVPSVVSHVEAVKSTGWKDSSTLNPAKRPSAKCGADLYLVPDTEFPQFDLEVDANNFIGHEKEDVPCMRVECPKIDASNIRQAIPRDCNQAGNGKEIILENRVTKPMKLNKLLKSHFPASQSRNLPLELRCPICNTFLKEAVMIPCCQHSFCAKCIKMVLTENGMCPRCFSSKCNVKNLLPNLSLRRAIEQLLESQLDTNLENAMQKYVPDLESGIHCMDVSCALYVSKRGKELPQSSSATGKGSNQVFVEPYYDQHHGRNMIYRGVGNTDIESGLPSQHITGIKADSENKRKDGFRIDIGGRDSIFSALGGDRKGVRNCYICGSSDHLMRQCPVSNPNPNPMFQPGYTPTYWNAPFRPYANMYGNPSATMMPFNVPYTVSPFSAPLYVPFMCGGMSGPGNMQPPHRSEYFGLQHCENSRKHSNENLEREQLFDNKDDSPECYRRDSLEKSLDYKLLRNRKDLSLSCSGNSMIQRSDRKSQHDRDKYNARRSNTGNEEIPRSSDRLREGRHKHHYGESKKHLETIGNHDKDSSLLNYQKNLKRRSGFDARASPRKRRTF